MRTILAIGLKDLRLRLRDRSAILISFIAPLVLATIISFAFGNEDNTFATTYAVADLDQSAISRAFVQGIESIPAFQGLIKLKPVASEEEARKLTVEGGAIGAAFVIPKGFAEGITTLRTTEIKVLRNVAVPIRGEIAEAIANGFVAEVNATRVAIQTAVQSGALARPGAPTPNQVVQIASSIRIPVNLIDGPVGANEVRAADYFGPSMSIFFLFFTVQFGALGVLAERRDGTMARLFASPSRRWQVIVGKLLSSFVLGIISVATMIAATSIILGANWGDPIAVAAITMLMTLAAMGITGLVIVVAKTYESAQGFASIIAAGFALLGGNFIQITDAPAVIRTASLLTPNGWALRAFFDLVAEGGGIESILAPLAAIAAFAVVTGGIALALGRRLVVA